MHHEEQASGGMPKLRHTVKRGELRLKDQFLARDRRFKLRKQVDAKPNPNPHGYALGALDMHVKSPTVPGSVRPRNATLVAQFLQSAPDAYSPLMPPARLIASTIFRRATRDRAALATRSLRPPPSRCSTA